MPCGAPQPTDGELEVLTVLWERGPSTVRDVHEVLSAAKDVGYTSVLKQLQGMHDKGLVKRNDDDRTHVFSAAIRKGHYVEDLVDRFFSGSVHELVMQALSTKKASPEELRELRALLKKAEGGKK
ncbi:BlaI/MecI/CopY family transcriptional regulator [soil metagenome]